MVKALKASWRALLQGLIDRLIQSMPRRVTALQKAKD